MGPGDVVSLAEALRTTVVNAVAVATICLDAPTPAIAEAAAERFSDRRQARDMTTLYASILDGSAAS